MTYDEALKYIHGVSNFFCKPGLERISALCHALGNPQNELNFIHVAGTNGKGSVSSMLSSVLRAAGYKVGLYTSPYILRFNERIRVDGESISDEALAALTDRVKAVAEKMDDRPTEFEVITAIAFEHFRNEKCDVVVLEVGMGGRLDATNIIEAPTLSVITGIALDHVAFLGDTVEKIAYEKAGIIKEGSAVLWGGDNIGAEAVIRVECSKKQTILYKTDYSKLKICLQDLCGTTFDYRGRSDIKLSLLGSYQPKNAAIVLDAVDILRARGMNVSDEAVKSGLADARWQARFEIIKNDPTVIFDGAHNEQGISAAVESIKKYFNERVIVLTGVLSDKDYPEIARKISEIAAEVFTITPSNPRALSAEKFAELFGKNGTTATPCDSVKVAMQKALEAARTNGTALCCLGSLYTYESVMDTLSKL